MIDSHCHLNFDKLKNNLKEIIENIKSNNISSVLTINTDPDEFDDHLDLIDCYQSIFISYGLHPETVSKNKSISKSLILKKIKNKKVIAIGETGLDFYRSTDFIKEQYLAFENHIEASIESGLPLIIHQRNSENEIIEVLKSYLKTGKLNLVFHCFTGSSILKNFCLDNGFYLSLSGIITFKNADNLRNVISDVPLRSLLIETDSPFLTPVPFRGKLNQPSNVLYVAKYLSEFYNIPLSKLINFTDENFYRLFSKATRYNEII